MKAENSKFSTLPLLQSKIRTILSERKYLTLSGILFIAIIVRCYFFSGAVFSDDIYYSKLSVLMLDEGYANYIGYPIFYLRKLLVFFSSLSFKLFGINEVALVLPSFIFSIAGIILVYKTSLLFSNYNTALLTALLLAFFPPDIIFATISFADLQCAFFLNLGIYFLIKAHNDSNNLLTVIGGLCFSLSLLIKEYAYFIIVLMIILCILNYFKSKELSKEIVYSLSILILFIVAEGLYYYLSEGNFFYRIDIIKENYIYSSYDFFPYTLLGSDYNPLEYLTALIKQIFALNVKYLFLRRYYLGVALVALIFSIYFLRKKEYTLLTLWFILLAFIMLGFTTSFTDYKPLDLRRSWYIFPLVPSSLILTSIAINNLKPLIRSIIITAYILFAIVMSFEYQTFFDIDSRNRFKDFLKRSTLKVIYTDHHTKYGIDLIQEYSNEKNVKVFTNNKSDVKNLSKNDLVIINWNVINEMKLQGHMFPDFAILDTDNFEKIKSFNDFLVYKKN